LSLRGRRTWCARCRVHADRAARLACTHHRFRFSEFFGPDRPVRLDGDVVRTMAPDDFGSVVPPSGQLRSPASLCQPLAGEDGPAAGWRVAGSLVNLLMLNCFLKQARRSSTGRVPSPLVSGGQPASLPRPLPACPPGPDSAGTITGQQVCPDRSKG